MLYSFDEYVMFEALRDNLVLLKKHDKKLYNDLSVIKDKPFENDARLLRKYKNIKLLWYNKQTHDIIKRIKERTRSFSTSHFNDILYQSLNQVNLSTLEDYTMYALYFKERNISVLFRTKKFSTEKELYIKTILLDIPPNDAEIIFIDDYLIY